MFWWWRASSSQANIARQIDLSSHEPNGLLTHSSESGGKA